MMKNLLILAFLSATTFAQNRHLPGCGFRGIFSCFRPQVRSPLMADEPVPNPEPMKFASADESVIVQPEIQQIQPAPPAPQVVPDVNPSLDLEREFARWLPAFNARSQKMSWANPGISAVRVISRQLKDLLKEQAKTKRDDLEFIVYQHEDNVFHWMVKFVNFQLHNPKESLTQDLGKMKIDEIITEVLFPSTYPIDPPLIRVLAPDLMYTGAIAMYHGIICTPLLTHGKEPDNWNSLLPMSAILRQYRQMFFDFSIRAKSSADPLNFEYSLHRALTDYKSAMGYHHKEWKLPAIIDKEFRRLA